MSNSSTSNMVAAVVLALGLMGGAWALGSQFGKLRDAGVITVKGLAEAEYQASLGTWRVGVNAWGADYATAMQHNQKQFAVLHKFLKEQGFEIDEFKTEEMDVSPHTEYYTDDKGERQSRENGFDASRDFVVSTKDLAKLKKAQSAILQLRAQNDTITFGSPRYYLEDLETIKRTLISKATQDAFVRAEEFAKTGKMKVGAMQSASQGSFDIQSASPSSEDSDSSYGGSYDTSTVDKRVRLVVTIQYRIDD